MESDVPEEVLDEKLVNYFNLEYHKNTTDLCQRKKESNHAYLDLDIMLLGDFDASLMNIVLNDTSKALKSIKRIFKLQKCKLFEKFLKETNKYSEDTDMDSELFFNLINVPLTSNMDVDHIPNSIENDRLVSLVVNVLRVSEPKILHKERWFKCIKCSYTFSQISPEDQYNIHIKPKICPSQTCKSNKFQSVSSEKGDMTIDYQEIRIQERIHKLGTRKVPKSITAVFHNHLVDSVKPGDQIHLIGTLKTRWRSLINEKNCELEIYIDSLGISHLDQSKSFEHVILEKDFNDFSEYWRINQTNPFRSRDAILGAVCPQMYGSYPIKLALILQMIGGSQKSCETMKIRGDIHILLVGDPGTGKSQFLQFVHSTCPRSILTTGMGSTSAGLTASASRDGGNWHLEAGALVLADGSICCIDEFGSIKESDKISIHEAMEQQTLSIAKAGMVNKLNTRCSILAATNPKGKYDMMSPLNINIALASPLISRFDVIMILLDNKNDSWDNQIADHLLKYHHQDTQKNNNSYVIDDEIYWTNETLKKYISCVKTFKPAISEEAKKLLINYYTFQRDNDMNSSIRTTVRLLESLIRLSTAHAKLMFHDTVTIDDAIESIFITEYSIRSSCIFSDRLMACQKEFPIDPDNDFQSRKKTIMSILMSETSSDKSEV